MKKNKLEKRNEKTLEKLYDTLMDMSGGDWYILSIKELDDLYESIMEWAGAFNKETGEHTKADEWSKEAHELFNICWKWYINIIKEKLRISKYYEKYYGSDDDASK